MFRLCSDYVPIGGGMRKAAEVFVFCRLLFIEGVERLFEDFEVVVRV